MLPETPLSVHPDFRKDAPGSRVPCVVVSIDAIQFQHFKTVSNHSTCRLGGIPLVSIRFSEPITEFAFLMLSVKLFKSYGADEMLVSS